MILGCSQIGLVQTSTGLRTGWTGMTKSHASACFVALLLAACAPAETVDDGGGLQFHSDGEDADLMATQSALPGIRDVGPEKELLVSIFQSHCLDTDADADRVLQMVSGSGWERVPKNVAEKFFEGSRPWTRGAFRNRAFRDVTLTTSFGGKPLNKESFRNVPGAEFPADTYPISQGTKINNTFGTFPSDTIGRKKCAVIGSIESGRRATAQLNRVVTERESDVRRLRQRQREEPGDAQNCMRSIEGWRFRDGEIVFFKRATNDSVCTYDVMIGYAGFVSENDPSSTFEIQ